MATNGKSQKGLREKLGSQTEERLGKALTELLENPILTGAVARAFDARERAAQAQEAALGALNIPSAADIERLTRRVRSVSQRLEGIEDGVDRLDRVFSPSAVEHRLETIEHQLETIGDRLGDLSKRGAAAFRASAAKHAGGQTSASKPPAKAAAKKPAAKKAAKKPAKAAAKKPAAKRAAKPVAKKAGPKKAPKPAAKKAAAKKAGR